MRISKARMITTTELKEKLIEGLGLEDIDANEIDDSDALFDDGLGLDSVDAIELIVILENEYGIKFKKMEETEDLFTTVQVLTDYINNNAK